MNAKDIEWFENLLLRHRLGIDDVAMISMKHELIAKRNSLKNRLPSDEELESNLRVVVGAVVFQVIMETLKNGE